MPQHVEELSSNIIEKAKAFLELKQGKNAEKAWAAEEILKWIVKDAIDEEVTTLESIQGAPFAQPTNDDNLPDYSDMNWVQVMRAMEEKGVMGKLVLGRHGWLTRFEWLSGSSLTVACTVLGLALPHAARQDRGRRAPATELTVGRLKIRLPLGGATDAEWAELARVASRRGR